MSPTTARPVKKSAKPRAPRYTDAMMADDAEGMLAEVVAQGKWSPASTGTLADNLARARALGLGPRSDGRRLLYATAEMIIALHEMIEVFDGFARQERRKAKQSKRPKKAP